MSQRVIGELADAAYRTFFEVLSPPTWFHDHDGIIVAANDAALSLYRYSREDFVGMRIERLLPDGHSPLDFFTPTSPNAFVHGGTHRRRDGTMLEVDFALSRLTLDAHELFCVSTLDVTDRRSNDARLARSEQQLAEAQKIAHLASFEWRMETNEVRWSDELYRIYGLQPGEFAATFEGFITRLHPDDRDHVSRTIRDAAYSGEPFHMEERIVRPDGSIRILDSRGHVVESPRGERTLIGVCHDVTDLREAERQRSLLAQRERTARVEAEKRGAEVHAILERITDAFVALDAEWRYTYVNRKAAEIFGRRQDELLGKHIWEEFPDGVGQPFHLAYTRALESQQPITIEEYYPPFDRWFENRIYPSPSGVAIFFNDISEQKKSEKQLQEMSDRLARTEEFSLVMVTHVGLDGRWIKVPPTLCRLLGYSESELLAMRTADVTHPDEVQNDQRAVERLLREEVRSWDRETRYLRKDGGIVWVYLNSSGVYDENGWLLHYVTYIRDITDEHRLEEQLRHQALHDDLTTLPNRALFNDRLARALAHAERHGTRVAVLLLELDAFRMVNDNFGHAFGDVLLREVADRLRTTVRHTDTLARMGGDEFAIILEDFRDEAFVVGFAQKALSVLNDRFVISSQPLHVSASVGMSIYPRDGHDGAMLLRNADAALGKAKEMGRNLVQLFAPTMSDRYRNRIFEQEELRGAIEKRELINYYQPLIRRSDRQMIGVEALVRWKHPTRGLIGPDDFIPLAEESRLILPLGELVLGDACRDLQEWTRQGLADLRLSVNLSVRQFQQVDLLERIDEILAANHFDPSRLEFEITESVAMKNVDYTMQLLGQLRARNISIAIDDFGTGQSSLIYLRQFPISSIKIDRMFIDGLTAGAADAAIVRAVIHLGRDLGLLTTAEGVETEEQLALLDQYGCDVMQGYLFSRPVACEEIEQMLHASRPGVG